MLPKEMIKALYPDLPVAARIDIKGDISQKSKEVRKIASIYHMIYRFSLTLLHNFAQCPKMRCMFLFYYESQCPKRFSCQTPLTKNKQAYLEAAQHIMNYSLK